MSLRIGGKDQNNKKTIRDVLRIGTYLFDDDGASQEEKDRLKHTSYDTDDPHFILRRVFKNSHVWDTLDPEAVKTMLNPPPVYDPEYQKKVNKIMLTCIAAINNKTRS
jgi:hypothetical protein